MTWVFATLLAVVTQVSRNSLSKHLGNKLSPVAVSFSRFLFGIPIVSAILFFSVRSYGNPCITNNSFWLWLFFFSLSQIAANIFLVAAFKVNSFAVAISLTKSEVIFALAFAFLFLRELPSLLAGLGIIIAIIGLVTTMISKEQLSMQQIVNIFTQKGAYFGLISGMFYALTAVLVKRALLLVSSNSILLSSSFTLLAALIFQSLLLLLYLSLAKRHEIVSLFQNLKIPLSIGSLSGLGSFLWFVAFSIAYVAYVKTLGQLEFLLSILISAYYFKEKVFRNEIIGMLLMVIGTIILMFAKTK